MMKKTNKAKRPVKVLNKDMFANYAMSDLCIAESFTISAKERQAIAAWVIEHLKKCQGPRNALNYSFRHTGIGVSVEVECPGCKETFDASDVDSW